MWFVMRIHKRVCFFPIFSSCNGVAWPKHPAHQTNALWMKWAVSFFKWLGISKAHFHFAFSFHRKVQSYGAFFINNLCEFHGDVEMHLSNSIFTQFASVGLNDTSWYKYRFSVVFTCKLTKIDAILYSYTYLSPPIQIGTKILRSILNR